MCFRDEQDRPVDDLISDAVFHHRCIEADFGLVDAGQLERTASGSKMKKSIN